ncbi:multiple sugar transport system permease protein [Catenuloplanes nepalensis]|uniref:Multiple sugar transport system permease protein n=1 Tax=Catenuloplanes nepalensis TaxID=587533 RepID=A0ABT9MWZ6_9ACTN|nr:sugar ABC transporter permease [Catenuloplanes nepalensis]MDP9795962.1 multiple sugar transport system permease protein [Catenuloplanes nepalensis]
MAVETPQRAPAETPAPREPGKPRNLTGLWFALPFLLIYAVFMIWPILAGLWSSLFNTSLAGGDVEFLGLGNYAEMARDGAVWDSLWNTAYFTLLSTPPLVLAGLGMALLAHRARRTGWLLRFAFFMPFLLPVTVVALIWLWIYQSDFGLLNAAIEWFGGDPVAWINDERTAMWAVVICTLWWTVGFNFLLYLAALQGIPRELHESAAVDGATPGQRLWRITLPLLRRTTGLVLVLQLIASLKIFDQVYLLNEGNAGPITRPLIQYVYEQGFTSYRIGYASAISYLLFLIIIVVAFAQFKIFSAGRDD